jgi:hypothetical protein
MTEISLCTMVSAILAIRLEHSRLIYFYFFMFNATFSYIMATSFSAGRSRSTRWEPPTMGKQLVNFITCGCTLFCNLQIRVRTYAVLVIGLYEWLADRLATRALGTFKVCWKIIIRNRCHSYVFPSSYNTETILSDEI